MKTKKSSAFTLIEMFLVVVILGALVGVMIPALSAARTQAQNDKLEQVNKTRTEQGKPTYKTYDEYAKENGINTDSVPQNRQTPTPDAVSSSTKPELSNLQPYMK
jgi:type II secretory pathway pseudopilin PulG